MRTKIGPVFVMCVAVAAGAPVRAQNAPTRSFAMPDSTQMATAMARALRRLRPAQFVLDHKAELGLTPEQIPFIESMALAQIDSERVRAERMMAAQSASMKTSAMSQAMAMMEWTGTVDEGPIREMAQRQVEASVASQVAMLRDRYRVGAVLTPAQISTLKQIEMSDLTGGRVTALLPPAPAKGGAYFEFQVDKQAVQVAGTGPVKYPDALRASKVEGEVLAQFVVDTTGHYEEGSFHVIKSSHQLFSLAVHDALPLMRFTPAEVKGAKVRQLVQQPFVFSPNGVK